MRNSTKLKNILLKYSLALDLEGELFKLTLVDKQSNLMSSFEGGSYSEVLRKAHSHLLLETKPERKPKRKKK